MSIIDSNYISVRGWKDSTNLEMIRLPSGAHISNFCGLRENKPFKGRNCVLLILKSPDLNPESSRIKRKTKQNR